jgi:CBS domain-containing protein
VIGMITDRDITCRAIAEGRDPATTMVADVMSTDVVSCFDDQDVTDAAHLMEEKQVHRLPVLNHDNDLVGVLALADLALHSPHELSGEVIEAVSKHVH